MDERYDANGKLKERFVDSKTGIEYVLQGDYYIPNIAAPENIKTVSYTHLTLPTKLEV